MKKQYIIMGFSPLGGDIKILAHDASKPILFNTETEAENFIENLFKSSDVSLHMAQFSVVPHYSKVAKISAN